MNARKTKTMIVSMSRTMHPLSPASIIGETVLKESDFLVILGVIFNSKMTFEKHYRSVSRSAFQRLRILRKSWLVSHEKNIKPSIARTQPVENPLPQNVGSIIKDLQ